MRTNSIPYAVVRSVLLHATILYAVFVLTCAAGERLNAKNYTYANGKKYKNYGGCRNMLMEIGLMN